MTPRVRAPHIRPRVALVLLTLGSTGCGFLFTHAPPENHTSLDYFACTESNTGPILDVIWAGLNVLGALVVLGDRDWYRNPDATIAGGLAWGVVSGVAAGVGFGKTRRCRDARQQLARRTSPGAGAPAPRDAIQAVVVSPATATIAVGERVQLTATAHDSSGAAVGGRTFTWSSSNDAIASVGAAGLVTAHAAGQVVIAARSGNAVGIVNITVTGR